MAEVAQSDVDTTTQLDQLTQQIADLARVVSTDVASRASRHVQFGQTTRSISPLFEDGRPTSSTSSCHLNSSPISRTGYRLPPPPPVSGFRRPPTPTMNYNNRSTSGERINPAYKQFRCSNCGKTHQAGRMYCPARDACCHYCNRIGHFQSVCRQKLVPHRVSR